MRLINRDNIFLFLTHGVILMMIAGFVMTESGCHTAKKITKTVPVASFEKSSAPNNEAKNLSSDFILQKLKENTIPFQTFSAHAKLDITTPNGTQSGIATYIRMQKDSVIWISIRPVLGIELVRILITPDSVKMINFFKKTITLRSADSLQQLFRIPFDFSSLQDLIVGNPPVVTDSIDQLEADSVHNGISFSCQSPDWLCDYLMDAGNYLLLKNALSQMDTSTGTRSAQESFGEYMLIDQHQFSTKRHFVIQTGSETTADIKFSHVEFNKIIDFPFPEVNNFRRD
jgi:hypothetical protein